MIINWIYKKLKYKSFQEHHKVTQLQWQKAELERKIAILKNNQ